MKKVKISFSDNDRFRSAESTILDMLVLHLILPYEEKRHPCVCFVHLNAGSEDHIYIEGSSGDVFTIIHKQESEDLNVSADGEDAGIYLAHRILENEGKCKHCVIR